MRKHGNTQRKIARRTVAHLECGVLEERSKDRGNRDAGVRHDEWSLLRSIAKDSRIPSGIVCQGEKNQSAGQLGGTENGSVGLRTGRSTSQRSTHSDVQRQDGNHERQPPNGLRLGSRPTGVDECCFYCGRGRSAGHGCRCGQKYPSRRCSRHGGALRIMAAPVWRGSGTDADPHRITRWFEFLTCPQTGCGYSRPLKAPTGDRCENRKTAFIRTKTARAILTLDQMLSGV